MANGGTSDAPTSDPTATEQATSEDTVKPEASVQTVEAAPVTDDLATPSDPIASSEASPPERRSKSADREQFLAERAERIKQRQRATDELAAVLKEHGGEDGPASLMPVVRHLAFLTEELSEAHRTIGRVGAERDAVRKELVVLKRRSGGQPSGGSEVSDSDPPSDAGSSDDADDMLRMTREERLEARNQARAAKQAQRLSFASTSDIDPSLMAEMSQRAAETGRRRRLIALSIMGVIALSITMIQTVGPDVPWSTMSRDGIRGLDYVGPLITLMMLGFLIYRVIRVGTKGARWLYPDPEETRRRRR